MSKFRGESKHFKETENDKEYKSFCKINKQIKVNK